MGGLFGGGGRGGGGAAQPQIIQPEMPQHPLLSQGLIPGATGRMNASMPWLQSGMRTIDYFNSPQFTSSPMMTPQFNQGQYNQQMGQQQQRAWGWQSNLDSFFPSPWGTMLSYAGGQGGGYRVPTGGGGAPGGMPGGQFGGPYDPPGYGNPSPGGQAPGGPGGRPDLERYVARDPQTNSVVGGSFETPEQWAAYNGFSAPQQQQGMFPIPSPQAQPQAPTPTLRTGGGVTPQAMAPPQGGFNQQQNNDVWNSLTETQRNSLMTTGSAGAVNPNLRTGGGNTPQAMGS